MNKHSWKAIWQCVSKALKKKCVKSMILKFNLWKFILKDTFYE